MKLIYTGLLAMASLAQLNGQTVIYVSPGATGTGTSWADATGNLALAMSTAVPNTEIWVKQGTYYPTTCSGTCTDTDRNKSFLLKPGVSVTGGFIGTETFRLEANPFNLTVLSGDLGTAGDPSDNSYNVVFAASVGVSAGLENFTVTGGNANRVSASGFTERGRAGAALYIDGAGAGMVSSPFVKSCRFINNDVVGRGGALYCNAFAGEVSAIFSACEFAFNTSLGDGGSVAIDGTGGTANPKFRDCDFHDNGTIFNPGTSQSGGAMFVSAQNGTSVIDVDRCRFNNNAADVSTAGAMNGNSSANGGAIYLTNSGQGTLQLNVNNSILSNNSSFSAGAIYNLGGTTNFNGVTITGNRALGSGGSGGGLYINGGLANVVNSIFWNNLPTENIYGGKDIRFVNGTLNVSYTLVEAADRDEFFSRSSLSNGDALNDGAGIIYGTDPMFDFGGGLPDLQATSPAVNAGDNVQSLTLGGDYNAGNRIQAGTVDLGALESSSAPLPVQLINFAAETLDRSVQLEWLVASESQLAGYRLERSADGIDYQEIAEVLAMGAGQYGFEDRAVLAGERYYYRLRSVDFDGTDYLSEVVTAQLEADASAQHLFTRIYPNPTAGELRVTLAPRADARTVYATVIDITGRKLRMWPLTTDGEHVLPLGDLPAGPYVIRLAEGSREQTAGFSIQH